MIRILAIGIRKGLDHPWHGSRMPVDWEGVVWHAFGTTNQMGRSSVYPMHVIKIGLVMDAGISV